jgi:hypothetical protein
MSMAFDVEMAWMLNNDYVVNQNELDSSFWCITWFNQCFKYQPKV